MSKMRILHLLPMFALVATFIVTACQPIRSQTASPASGEQDIASREELKAKIIAMEFATFDHLRQHDVAAVDAEISADYLWIDATGIKGRADYLAVVADEKLQFGEPERGAVEVRILSPAAVLVMYPMTTHGSYDGEEFTGHEYLSSLWMKRAGEWQNVFLQSSPQEEQESPPAAATVEVDQALATKSDALMTNLHAEGTFNGAVLIAHNGQVLLRKGYGLADREQNLPNTPTTRFRLASLTKQFTAMAILMLQEQGKLHVDDPVCQYIPDCPAAWQAMTIHHLLTHTAGVYDLRDFIYTGQTPPAPSTSAQVIERIKAQPLAFAPGEGSSYTNGGFMVAGYIVEQVSGQSYAQFLQEHIFDPLGMKNTGYADDTSGLAVGYRNATTPENPLDSSLPFAAAGLYSTVDDLYLYAQALDSGQLLSPPALETFFNQHVQFGADNGGFSPGYEAPVAYAYGWGVATFHGHRVIGHDGWIEGYGGDFRRYPDDHISTILLMNQSEPYAALIGDQLAAALFASE